MTVICNSRIDASRFNWSDKVPAAEASELGFRLSRVYDDACDLGVLVVSPRTGAEAVFYLASEDTDGEDVYGWRLRPTAETERRFPRLKGREILVIND